VVSCPVQVFPAVSQREKVRQHQINRRTGNRIRYCRLDAVTGEEVDRDDIVMGYEVSKGRYIEITDDERASMAIESAHVIDIDRFVPRGEVDEVYLHTPYFITPDGEVGQQAYAVIREAIRHEGVIALGRVTFTTREHVIAIEPRHKGLLGLTLRYPYEIRSEEGYFGGLPDEPIPKEMLNLARHIIENKLGHFEPDELEDRYERALRELIRRKQRGEPAAQPKERAPAQVIDLMDALRRSVAAEKAPQEREGAKRRPAAHRRRASMKRSSAAARKAS
jgi:DNA end-binding protein Ku